MSHCLNYRRDITEKFLQKAYDKPISCPRIRQEYPELTASLGCDCRLHIADLGYPSPILHANIKHKSKIDGAHNAYEEVSESKKDIDARLPEVEILLRRLIELRKQKKGIEHNIDAIQKRLGIFFDEMEVSSLETSLGNLNRVPGSGEDDEWIIEL
jgi:hypothetical protein